MFRQWLVESLEASPIGFFVNEYTWAWPIAESFHFIGLCLLVGTVAGRQGRNRITRGDPRGCGEWW